MTTPGAKLAIHGGPAIFPAGPPSWPPLDTNVKAVLEATWRDGSWGRYHGPHVTRLEELLCQFNGASFALSCCSGTFAVELALRGLDLRPDDEVILAGYDFPGNFRSIEAVGARPVLVDVDPRTWCLDPDTLAAAVSGQTRAILVSHLHGGLADMQRIREFADQAGLTVVEDVCQAPGASVQGRVAGCWGDVSVLSFGGSKLLTAGRGGAILTRREEVYQRAKIYCERGNHAFPLSELQAACLPAQLESLNERNQKRQAAVSRLLAATEHLDELRPVTTGSTEGRASYYKLAWRYQEQHGGLSRQQFIAAIQAEGVAIDVGFRGFTRRGPRRCRRAGSLDHSQRASDQTLLLHHPVLLSANDTIDLVTAAIEKVLQSV